MTISSLEFPNRVPDIALSQSISSLLGQEPFTLVPLPGGKNSRVYALTSGRNSGSQTYILKHYFSHRSDKRHRLRVEFESLRFLWEHGVRSIPQPLVADEQLGVALYQRINGRALSPREVNIHDIDYATDFLLQLSARRNQGNVPLWPASDACFSLRRMEEIVERRLTRLLSGTMVERDGREQRLRLFLEDQFFPVREEILSWAKGQARAKGIVWEQELPFPQRTLSPSDFGFHNALRQDDGKIIFYDFEYFGWDDPAKMIADFLLHPAMELNAECKKRYVYNLLRGFSADTQLPERIRLAYPLLGLVWCLILLNEFVVEDQHRRQFAGQELRNGLLQEEQLSKAERMLMKIGREYNDVSSSPWASSLGFMEHRFDKPEIDKPRPDEYRPGEPGLKEYRPGEPGLKEYRLGEPGLKEYRLGEPRLKEYKLDQPSLDERSRQLRKMVIKVVEKGKRGHIPSAFSMVEILRVLFDEVLRYDSQNPQWDERDRFILSKGHGCIILYVLLAEKGFFPEEELWKFCTIDGRLGGHPERSTPGVEWSTGSLGHGLPVAVGMAWRGKRDGKSYRVFTVLGDGESNEGSVWEAAMCASKHRLDNLVVLVDYNKQVTYGTTYEVQDLEPFADKWKSFGFSVREVDGHDLRELRTALQNVSFEEGKPSVLLCHTVKGKGIKMMERNFPWHHKSSVSTEEIQALFKGLEEYDG